MAGSYQDRLVPADRLGGFGLPVRLVAGWIRDVPQRIFTASIAVSIESAVILTLAGVRHGVRADANLVRLLFTTWATALLLFVSTAGFVLLSIERYFSVIERTQEIGVLKVLGASMRYFLLLMFLEAAAICVPGTVAGIGLTFLVRWGLAFAFPNFLRLDVVYLAWPVAFGITVAAAMIGGYIGARKAIRDGVTRALSYEG